MTGNNYQAVIEVIRNEGDKVETYYSTIVAPSVCVALDKLYIMCFGESCYNYKVTKLNRTSSLIWE